MIKRHAIVLLSLCLIVINSLRQLPDWILQDPLPPTITVQPRLLPTVTSTPVRLPTITPMPLPTITPMPLPTVTPTFVSAIERFLAHAVPTRVICNAMPYHRATLGRFMCEKEKP